MTAPLLGRSLNRLEDERFLRGQGRYVADLAVPGALHGLVVRSTHAHARIVAVDIEKARAMQGVVAVFTSADLAADNIGPLPCAVTHIPMAAPLVVPPAPAPGAPEPNPPMPPPGVPWTTPVFTPRKKPPAWVRKMSVFAIGRL